MSEQTDVPPLDAPEHLRAVLAHCITGRIPANVAAMQLLLRSSDIVEIETALERTMELLDGSGDEPGIDRLRQVAALLERHPNALRLIQDIMRQVPHTPEGMASGSTEEPDPMLAMGQAFDAAFDISPEASVALYSLGDRDLLDIATAEIIRYLHDLQVLGPDKHVLDIGCGFGRVLEALAPEVATANGIDISERMVAAARSRCAALENVHIVHGSGHDLSPFPDESVDLALAVDSFPYITLSGGEVIAELIAEIERVLKPGGRLIIFNYSYREDAERDETDLNELASEVGFDPVLRSHARFHTWDATVFQLHKGAGART